MADLNTQLLARIARSVETAEEGEYQGDPALDPLLWRDAGANATLTLPTSLQIQKAELGRLSLPRPMVVTVQVSTQIALAARFDANTGVRLRVDWQSGRGNQTAWVDAGLGTTFTVSAAQAITLQAAFAGTTAGASVLLNSTFAPATALNPMPATWTTIATCLAGVAKTVAPTPNPDFGPSPLSQGFVPFAKKLWIYTDQFNNSPAVRVQLLANATVTVDEFNTRGAPILVGGIPFDRVDVTSPVNANVALVWELVL